MNLFSFPLGSTELSGQRVLVSSHFSGTQVYIRKRRSLNFNREVPPRSFGSNHAM
jgi:hypothetical protein